MKLRLITAIALGALYVQAHATTDATNNLGTTATTTKSQIQPSTTTPTSGKTITLAQADTQANKAAPTAAPAPTTASNVTVPKITVDKDKVSYGIGMDLGANFKAQGIEIDPAMVERGLKDATSGTKPLYTQQEMASTLVEFQKQLIAKRQAEFALMAAKNQQQSNAFLQTNKSKPGIVTTASGLQYKVVDAGKGTATPSDKDVVTVDYVGSLPNGQVFDSSYKRGKPVTFPVGEVIPGWTEALKLMKPGSTYEIYVPSNLAYGDRGLPPVIGPNQALVFKIHLIAIGNKANASQQG